MAELLTLARPYAKAVFNLAQQSNQLQAWSDTLKVFSMIAQHKDVRNVQSNPNVSVADVVDLYCSVSGSDNEQVKNFLQLLAHNDRLILLPDIYLLFEQHKSEALKQIDVELTSAFPVTDKQRDMFSQALAEKLGRKVNLLCKENPALIGGAVLRAGDKVIDGSVRGRLYKMAESLGA